MLTGSRSSSVAQTLESNVHYWFRQWWAFSFFYANTLKTKGSEIQIFLFLCIAHGTFIGSIKLDANKPQQVFIDSELKFGASTRTYIVRERPQANKHFPSMLMNTSNDSILKEDTEEYHNSSLNLPENEAELDVMRWSCQSPKLTRCFFVVNNNKPLFFLKESYGI